MGFRAGAPLAEGRRAAGRIGRVLSPLHALAIVLGLALAALGHYLFWSRRLRVRTGEDELLFAVTEDGWRLALGRRRPRGAARSLPVLLVHGVAANRASLDFGLERYSLSAYLAAAGFDCYALDLRGHGASRRVRRGAKRGFTFDDHLSLDVPAALDRVRSASGQERVLWVGHSQGGLLGMAACARYGERVAALCALGSPAFFPRRATLSPLLLALVVLAGRANRFLARMLAPFSGYYHPRVSEIAVNPRNVEGYVYRRMLATVVENVSSGVLRQLAGWAARDAFASADGAVDYRALLGRCRQPALFVAAEKDRIAPPEAAEKAAAAWGGAAEVLRLGVAGRTSGDYGHADLLFGRSAPEEVFVRVREFLVQRSEGREQPPLRGAPPARGSRP